MIEPGYAYTCIEQAGSEVYIKTSEIGQASIGIVSDTYGFSLGDLTEEEKKTYLPMPIAIGGYVLAHVDKKYPFGTALTSGANGYLTEADEHLRTTHPERILATYWKSESFETWRGIEVKGRSWVKIV